MRKQVATLLTVVFMVSLSLTANAAIKPGTSCKQLGQTSISSGKKYVCVKSGKKLVWNQGVLVKRSYPVVTPTPTPTLATFDQPLYYYYMQSCIDGAMYYSIGYTYTDAIVGEYVYEDGSRNEKNTMEIKRGYI